MVADDGSVGYGDLAGVFAVLPMAAMIVQGDGGVVAMNPVALAAFEPVRFDHGGARQVRLGDVFAAETPGALDDLRAAAGKGVLVVHHVAHVDRAEASRAVTFRVIPLDHDDLHARRYLMLESDGGADAGAGPSSEDLALHTARREHIRRLKLFSSQAAHDIKSPLRQIGIYLQALEEDYMAEAPVEALHFIGEARARCARLQDLVSALWSHARTQTSDLTLTDVDLAGELETVIGALWTELMDAGARVERPKTLPIVRADAGLVRQIFEHILQNSITYRKPDQALVISVGEAAGPGGGVTLTFKDNGTGFNPEDAAKALDPLTRLHEGKDIAGSGMGLAIVNGACQRLGWRLEADSVEGEWAAFSLVVPGA